MERADSLFPRARLSGLARIVLIAALASPAMAGREALARNTGLSAGVGVGVLPEYEGSGNYRPIPLLSARLQHGPYYVHLQGPRLEANLVPSQLIRMGPLVNLRFERDELENDQVDALPRLDYALEAGAFASARFPVGGNPRQALILRMDFLHDVTGVHEGYLASPSVEYTAPVLPRVVASLTLSGTYAGGGYTETYFTITPSGSAASGLPVFRAESGIKDAAVGLDVRYRVSERLGLVALARWTRLLGDARESPIVDRVGDPNQVFGGLFLSWRFSL